MNDINNSNSELIGTGIENGQYPARLFKYYNLDNRLIKSIKNNYLWFNSFENYNDPYEGRCHIKQRYSKQVITDWLVQQGFRRKNFPLNFIKAFPDILRDSISKAAKNVRVCCFSQEWDNLLLWAHYADSYRGICLEFDTEKLSSMLPSFSLLPVKYEHRFKTVDYIQNPQDAVTQLVITKAKAWKYEKEFRFVSHGNPANIVHINLSALTSVIVGPKYKNKEWHFNRLKRVLPSHVQIKYCDLDAKAYRLILMQ